MIPRILGLAAIGVLALYLLKVRSRSKRYANLAGSRTTCGNRHRACLPRALPMPASDSIH